MRAFPRRAARAALLVLLLAAPACSTGAAGAGGKTGAVEARPQRTPGEGTIVYHEPRSSTGIQRKSTAPQTLVFTTAEEGVAEDRAVRTVSGTVAPGEDAAAVARRLLESPKVITRLLSPAKFSDLWEKLAATGVLDLPRHRGKDLPGEDYFLFQSAEGRVVITRPAVASPPRPEDPNIARLDAWRKAKLELFDFLNER